MIVDNRTNPAQRHALKSALNELIESTRVVATPHEVRALYATSVSVYGIVNYRANTIAQVPMRVVSTTTGEPLPEHPLTPVFDSANYRRVIQRMEYSLSLMGHALAIPNPNVLGQFVSGTKNLLWINPRYYTLREDAMRGLMGIDILVSEVQGERILRPLKPEDALYLHTFSFESDFDGISPAEAAFSAAGAQSEMLGTQFAYFKNRMLEAFLLQPAAGATPPPKSAADKIQEFVNRLGVGRRNAGRTTVLNDRWEALEVSGDFEKLAMRVLSEGVRTAICEAFQFPPELLTFQASNYAQSREAVAFWRESWAVPRVQWYASEMSEFFSAWYGTPLKIEPDVSAILPEDADKRVARATVKRDAGYIDQYTAALEAGVKDPPETLRGLYHVPDVGLVPADDLPNVWRLRLNAPDRLPIQSADQPTAPQLPAPDADKAPEGEPVSVILDMANDADLIALQGRVKALLADVPTEWTPPAEFHVTLVYAPDVPAEKQGALATALAEIDPPALSLTVGSLRAFDNVGEHAVHFRVRRNAALEELQAAVVDVFAALDIPISQHHQPGAFTPHITVGYASERVKPVTFNGKVKIEPRALACTRKAGTTWLDLYRTGTQPESVKNTPVYMPEDAYKELEVCARKAAKGAAFEPQLLPAATALYVAHLAHVGIEGAPLLSAAKAHYARVTAAKSIQSTRLDFEDQVEDLMLAAVAGTVKRDRFRLRLMQIIRGYGMQAYRDGLTDAGVEGVELDPEEEAEAEAFIGEQRAYVTAVAEAIYKDERVTPDEAAGKPEMWFNKSVYPLYTMGLASASKNALFEWVMGNAEHCDSCKALSGQRRRFSFWQDHIMPKDSRLQCHGYRCACNLVPYQGRASGGRLPRWQ